MPWRQPALGPHSSHGYEVAALSPISHLYPRQEEKTTRQREGGRGKEKGETEEEEMRSVYFRKKKKIRNTQQTSTRVLLARTESMKYSNRVSSYIEQKWGFASKKGENKY